MRKILTVILAVGGFLGCAKGDPGSGPTPIAGKNMSWSFQKSCNDGFTAYLKLYDRNNGTVWPDVSSSWTLKNGERLDETIRCEEGNKICFGAANNGDDSKGYWGIGIGHFLGCADCCRTCGTSSDALRELKCS